jgi:hypothetical protein
MPEMLDGRNNSQDPSLAKANFRRDFGKWKTPSRGQEDVSVYEDGGMNGVVAGCGGGGGGEVVAAVANPAVPVAGMTAGESLLPRQGQAAAVMANDARNRRALWAVGSKSLACRLGWWLRWVRRTELVTAGRLEMAVPFPPLYVVFCCCTGKKEEKKKSPLKVVKCDSFGYSSTSTCLLLRVGKDGERWGKKS